MTINIFIQDANTRNVRWPESFVGIVPGFLNVAGYVPQYITIYRKCISNINVYHLLLSNPKY